MPIRTRYHSTRNQGKSRSSREGYVERAIPRPQGSIREMPNPGQVEVQDPERRGNKLKMPQQRAPAPRKEKLS